MTARAAAIAPETLVDVFENVPEYSHYDEPDSVKSCESEYRISLGRVIKGWGDRLLDVAENARTPLSRDEMHSIDLILAGIAETFDELNRFRPTQVDEDEIARVERLRRADALIITILEESQRIIQALDGKRETQEWLTQRAEDMTRSLQALATGLERRNDVLLDGRRSRGDHFPTSGGL